MVSANSVCAAAADSPKKGMTEATPSAAPRGGRPLSEIETWIFDLDNTLYPLACNLFGQVEERMAAFIMAELEIDYEAAHRLRRHFFQRHGTTLRGLMLDHGVEPERFLHYVHDIDLSGVPADPALVAAINRLPGRKLVFTNATVRHAERVMARIGLTGTIEAVHDIVASAYVPKPAQSAYAALLAGHRIAPATALFVEDMARNLEPAAALGMTTAWVRSPLDWARIGSDQPYVHHIVDDLAAWLVAIPAAGKSVAGPHRT
jgi:putative hydrolase of the HAD superfamily